MNLFSGKNVRVREGQWHYRFKWNGAEYSGPTGLAGTKRNQKAAERFAVNEKSASPAKKKSDSRSRSPRLPASSSDGVWTLNIERKQIRELESALVSVPLLPSLAQSRSTSGRRGN